jgi:hypothetical protein
MQDFTSEEFGNNIFLHGMDTRLTDMQTRNTRIGFLSMAKAALLHFKNIPEVAVILQEQERIFNQHERPSVDTLRELLQALRANPRMTNIYNGNISLIRMIDFALAELTKGWNNNGPVPEFPHQQAAENIEKAGPFIAMALIIMGLVPKDNLPLPRNIVVGLLFLGALAGMVYSTKNIWQPVLFRPAPTPARNNEPTAQQQNETPSPRGTAGEK